MKSLAHSLPRPKQPTNSYLPDFAAKKVEAIDFQLLSKLGIRHLLFDLDQTLRSPYTRRLHPGVITLLTNIQASGMFKSVCLVSNNQRNISRYSEPIGARLFQPFRSGWKLIRKPNPLFFNKVLAELQAKPEQTVMIGDRLHADVLGGNRMGMYTIYIGKRGPIDYWFDWLLLTRLRDRRRFNEALSTLRKQKRSK